MKKLFKKLLILASLFIVSMHLILFLANIVIFNVSMPHWLFLTFTAYIPIIAAIVIIGNLEPIGKHAIDFFVMALLVPFTLLSTPITMLIIKILIIVYIITMFIKTYISIERDL